MQQQFQQQLARAQQSMLAAINNASTSAGGASPTELSQSEGDSVAALTGEYNAEKAGAWIPFFFESLPLSVPFAHAAQELNLGAP
jgi:hypothetical protein